MKARVGMYVASKLNWATDNYWKVTSINAAADEIIYDCFYYSDPTFRDVVKDSLKGFESNADIYEIPDPRRAQNSIASLLTYKYQIGDVFSYCDPFTGTVIATVTSINNATAEYFLDQGLGNCSETWLDHNCKLVAGPTFQAQQVQAQNIGLSAPVTWVNSNDALDWGQSIVSSMKTYKPHTCTPVDTGFRKTWCRVCERDMEWK